MSIHEKKLNWCLAKKIIEFNIGIPVIIFLRTEFSATFRKKISEFLDY